MDNKLKKQQNKWFALINIPAQMGAIIYFSSLLGNKLDEKYPNEHNLFVKVLTIVGVALAFYNLNRQLKDINSSEN